MIKKLYNNWGWFKNQVNKIRFENQSKPINFENLEEKFTDSNGMRYYIWSKDEMFNMPLIRFQKLQVYIQELQSSFQGQELNEFVKVLEEQVDACVNNAGKGLAAIGHLIKEVEWRQQALFREDILFKMVGCQYIREDQDPKIWDQELEDKKIAQLMEDSKTGLSDFFLRAGMSDYYNFLKLTDEDLKGLSVKSKEALRVWNENLTKYSPERRFLKRSKQTLDKASS